MNEFSEENIKILQKFVSNIDKDIFVLINLPEVIKGALFSRYSRSALRLRELLLQEFILSSESSFDEIALSGNLDNILAIKKAKNFYDRILDGFGDDSIGELGGAHLAVENVSMLAAKSIEDARIGGSPLEKSTRYVYFDRRVNDEYLFYKEPIIMTSAYRDLYISTCNMLFQTYSNLIPRLTEVIKKDFPKEEGVSIGAYTAALRAKVLDCLRGLLPASTLTNMGVFGNGRFFESLIKKMASSQLAEIQKISRDILDELSLIIPSFVRRADPDSKYQIEYLDFINKTKNDLKILSKKHTPESSKDTKPGVFLIDYNKNSIFDVSAALLFEYGQSSLGDLKEYTKNLSQEELTRIFESSTKYRQNRRHKSLRALEHASFTFEIVADFGVYRDLQRHRMLTQERQLLTCNYGYFVPNEIKGTEMEKEYEKAMNEAKKTYDIIFSQIPEEAQYVVPMAYNMRWYFHVNLRSLQWLCELRSSPAGHPTYRFIAQEMVTQLCNAIPEFQCFFKFVDFDGYDLGRMDQEIKREEKEKIKSEVL